MIYHGIMDKECLLLCNAINRVPGLKTFESCCGHGIRPYRIWFIVDSLANLPFLLYYIDSCHVGFNWTCTVETDCGMSPVHFMLKSIEKGDMAYQQANHIAEQLEKNLDIYLSKVKLLGEN